MLSRNVGLGYQPGPWWRASSSTYGSAKRAATSRASVDLPTPGAPATKTRLGLSGSGSDHFRIGTLQRYVQPERAQYPVRLTDLT